MILSLIHISLAAARKFLDLIDARRECFTPDVHVNSIVVDGGKAPNIIPDYVKLRMEFRTATMKSMGAVDEMVKKCADGAALALDCAVKFTTVFEFADMVRNMALEEEVVRQFESCLLYTSRILSNGFQAPGSCLRNGSRITEK